MPQRIKSSTSTKSLIAITLVSPSFLTSANRSEADFIEIRTDLYPKANLTQLIARSRKPVIVTIKSPQSNLLDLIDLPNVRYVDIDYRLGEQIEDFHRQSTGRSKLIVSYHDFKETPRWSTIQQIVKRIQHFKPDVIKIATMIERFDDIGSIMRLQKQYGKKVIAIGMGELGIMTRRYNRGLLTYARLPKGRVLMPGQLTMSEMTNMQVYGLLGQQIIFSLSPLIHNTGFAYHHLSHRYQLWETTNVALFMEIFRFFKLPGASVTTPHKQAVMSQIDRLSVSAKKVDAVNTLLWEGNQILGDNTDWLGAQVALAGELRKKDVMVLGAGGAGQAVAYAAKLAKAKRVRVLNRSEIPTDDDVFDVLINATPVYDTLLVPEDALYGRVVMDCNYTATTELLRQAERKARIAMNGIPMLIYQAAAQFKLWTRKPLPVKLVQRKIDRIA